MFLSISFMPSFPCRSLKSTGGKFLFTSDTVILFLHISVIGGVNYAITSTHFLCVDSIFAASADISSPLTTIAIPGGQVAKVSADTLPIDISVGIYSVGERRASLRERTLLGGFGSFTCW